MLILLVSISFLLQTCYNDIKRITNQEKQSTNLETPHKLAPHSYHNINTIFKKKEVFDKFISRGFTDAESNAKSCIALEKYQGSLGHIVFTGSHFYYKDGANNHYEGQTNANCSIYAMARLFNNLGQVGYIDKDLWKKYSDAELRVMIDKIAQGRGYYLNEGQPVTATTLRKLMQILLSDASLHGYCEIHNEDGTIVTY